MLMTGFSEYSVSVWDNFPKELSNMQFLQKRRLGA